jgi:epoxide hydrolase 4
LSRSHRVIALDLKGFSDSDKPVLRHNYRPNVICAELKDFLEALDIKTVTIIGHDLGGLIGWIFALQFPDFVTKLIAISAPHPNLYWQVTSKTALLGKKWCRMVQVNNEKLQKVNVKV